MPAVRTLPEKPRRSLAAALDHLRAVQTIKSEELGSFEVNGERYCLPKFSFRDRRVSDPIRIGIFSAIHGDEPAGAHAVVNFLTELATQSELSFDYEIFAYPICNPTGFEDNTRNSRRGYDLNREFWKNSTEMEVQLLEHELRTHHFSGIIQLHADDTSDGIYGFVRGHTLTENLLRPALLEAGKILPRNINALIDGFAARDGIIYDLYEGVLACPAAMNPVPFEIVFETPGNAPLDLQVPALVVALKTILTEYRNLISFAQNISSICVDIFIGRFAVNAFTTTSIRLVDMLKRFRAFFCCKVLWRKSAANFRPHILNREEETALGLSLFPTS